MVYEGQYHVVQETSEKVHFEYIVCVARILCLITQVPQSRKTVPIGGAPYKSAKKGGGRSFECFRI